MEASQCTHKITFEEWKFQEFCSSIARFQVGLALTTLVAFVGHLLTTRTFHAGSFSIGSISLIVSHVMQICHSSWKQLNLQVAGLLLHLGPSVAISCVGVWSFQLDALAGQQMHRERFICIEFSIWLTIFQRIGFKYSSIVELLLTHVTIVFGRWTFLYFCFDESLDLKGCLVGMIVCLGATYSCYLHDAQARCCFQSLTTSQKLVEKMQTSDASMRAMIGGLFQASCICDVGGKLMHSSVSMKGLYDSTNHEPHSLLQILEDPRRFLNFLRMASRSEGLRAESLSVTVCPTSQKPRFDSTLYCIPLPQGRGLLLGMATSEDETTSDLLGYNLTEVLENASQTVDRNDLEYLEWRSMQSQFRKLSLAQFSAVVSVSMAVLAMAFQDSLLELHLHHGVALACLVSGIMLVALEVTQCNQMGMVFLEVLICWSLHGLSLCLNLTISQLVLQHRFFMILHCALMFTLPSMVDIPTRTFSLTVPPVQFCSFAIFHSSINWALLQFHITSFAGAMFGCYLRWTSEKQLTHTFSMLQRERIAQTNLCRHVQTMERLRDSLFDGSCLCDTHLFEVKSSSALFTHSLGMNYSGLSIPTVGFSIKDKIAIASLLASTRDQHSSIVSTLRCSIRKACSQVSLPCKVKLFAFALLAMDKHASETLIWVGIQLLEDIETLSEADSNFSVPRLLGASIGQGSSSRSSTSSLTPEDSVSVRIRRGEPYQEADESSEYLG